MIRKTLLNKKQFCSMRDLCYDPNGDYYNLLGIKDNSEPSEIKKSFFSLSMKMHPDKGGKEEDFKKISKAYEILKNQDQRIIYDKLRQEFLFKENHKAEQVFKKKEKGNKEDSHKQHNYYRYARQHPYYNDEFMYYRENMSSHQHYSKNPNWNGNKNTSSRFDGSNNYRETNEEEIFKMYNEYYEIIRNCLRKHKAEKDIIYKINIKYIPPERENLFDDFVFTRDNKHFIENRIQKFEEVTKNGKSKKKVNQFQIFNDMNNDQDYLDCLNKVYNEDESLDKKIRIRDVKKLSLSMALIVISYFIMKMN
jgi:curved DNA-binding protein CbpA